MQTFFDDSDEDVSTNCDPYLRLHGVLAGAQKGFDTQMLLDPFEEQFDLPALLVKCRDHLGLEREVVGQKDEALSIVVLDDDTPQCRRIILARIEKRQYARLVADDIACRSIDRMRIAASKAYTVASRSIPNGSLAYSGRAIAMRCRARSA